MMAQSISFFMFVCSVYFLEKDLGILIDCELKFSDHMFDATKKANGIMGIIRTFTHLDLKCFSLL